MIAVGPRVFADKAFWVSAIPCIRIEAAAAGAVRGGGR
jgi:hypothetical protein